MLKTDLVKRVSELETKLKDSNWQVFDIISTANKLIKWVDSSIYGWLRNMRSDEIDSISALFFEIWKLVEFKNNVLDEKWFERSQKDNNKVIEMMRERLKENNII